MEKENIRNIAILGHLGSGKTSFGEALLYAGKAIDKKGEVERKNTVSDYLAEEQSRQTSSSTSLIPNLKAHILPIILLIPFDIS